MPGPELRENPPPRIVPGEVEDNALGLDAVACRELAEVLNRALATLSVLAHMLEKHTWLARGPERGIERMLREHAQRARDDIDLLAGRVVALGGAPVSGPAAQEAMSSVASEPEGATTLRIMLERDQQGLGVLARGLRRGAGRALELKDFGTAHVLMGVLERQERAASELRSALADESLVIGVARSRFGLRDVRPPAAERKREAGGSEPQTPKRSV